MLVSDIQQHCAEYYGLEVEQVLSASRKKTVARARQLAMWFTRELLGMSYAEIAEAFGGKDHTTVMHAVKKIEFLRQIEIPTMRAHREVSMRINGGKLVSRETSMAQC